jgi:CheY-like chemotaxis protein
MTRSRIVIVADDDCDTRECVARFLREGGLDVRLASHGRAALELLDVLGDQHCVLVLDLSMPIMTGVEVVGLLARTGRLEALPVIVCSAATGNEPLPSGVRHVLEKPVDPERLMSLVRQACALTPDPPPVVGPRALRDSLAS